MKKVYVGSDPFPPYQYYKKDGSPAGSDYDYIRKLFAEIGYEMEVTIEEWPQIEKLIDARKLDAAFQVQKTEERVKKYCFSRVFRNAETQLITASPDVELNDLTDIPACGLVIGVIEGYTNAEVIDNLPEKCKKAYPGASALLKAISNKEVDLGVFDKGVKEYLMEQLGISNLHVLDKFTFLRPLHVIFNDAELRDKFDTTLEDK